MTLWKQLGHFEAIDSDKDGRVSAVELATAVGRLTDAPASPITVDLVLKAIDKNQDGMISTEEADALNRRTETDS